MPRKEHQSHDQDSKPLWVSVQDFDFSEKSFVDKCVNESFGFLNLDVVKKKKGFLNLVIYSLLFFFLKTWPWDFSDISNSLMVIKNKRKSNS